LSTTGRTLHAKLKVVFPEPTSDVVAVTVNVVVPNFDPCATVMTPDPLIETPTLLGEMDHVYPVVLVDRDAVAYDTAFVVFTFAVLPIPLTTGLTFA
jgi:hypothetical protein